MAKALFEKREFTNKDTGAIVPYESYSIVGIDVNGDRVELPLKTLTGAEKIAFKMVAAMSDPINEQLGTASHKATADELVSHQEKITKTPSNKTILDDDDNEDGKIFD